MDGSDRRAQGDVDTAAEDWLRGRLTAYGDDVRILPPDVARIDARRRGIRRRRAGFAVCALSAVTATAVVTAVAQAGGGEGARTALPPVTPTVSAAPPAETAQATAPQTAPPTGTTGSRPSSGPTGSGDATTAPAGIPGTSSGTGTAKPTGHPTNTPSTSGSSSTTGQGDTTGSRACTDADVSITATTEPHDSGRHLLLTATNTGSTTCTLYRYPNVVFGAGAHDVPPMESPAAVATIGPGKKAYAGLRLFEAGEQVDTVTSLAVTLEGRVANGSPTSNPIDIRIPAELGGALNIGPNPMTTFWNTDLSALNRYLYAR
ncbi:MAG: DUF4232 domain-containing protein [Streptomycetaceae bacterium]|nr:DUF4232 domain-containing protein [Streptomycetaceae bacterium]